MEIRELADYIIYSTTFDGYVIWGKRDDGTYDWGLNKSDHFGYPMSYAEAEKVIEQLKQKYGGDYEIQQRKKTNVTLTLA